ncbi:MAG: penicillin-binding protein 2, partial [Micrococcales bacterium]|nr:penicillin-binding protein 2 [Micrococcales bacterium]
VVAAAGIVRYSSNMLPHMGFTGFAPADNPQVAVVVFVKNAGDGTDVVPMGKKVIEAALG